MTESTTDRPGARPVARVILAVAVLPLAIAVVGAAFVWSRRDELPAPVAVHWGAGGSPDDFMSVGAVVALMITFGVVFGGIGLGLSLAARAEPVLTRVLAGTAAGTTAFVTMLMAALVADQRGLADAAQAEAPPVTIVAALAFGAVVAAVAVWIVPPGRRAAGGTLPDDAPRVAVDPDERVVWTRSVATGSVPAAVLIAGVGVTVVTGVLTRQWWVLGLAAALAAVAALMFSITVTVDRRGMTIRGRFGWPRVHTPLDELARASVVDVHPIRHFGGYGYRISAFGPLRGAGGFVLRGGEALLVERDDGRRTVVVVDDAATAAGLLNGLLERRCAQ